MSGDAADAAGDAAAVDIRAATTMSADAESVSISQGGCSVVSADAAPASISASAAADADAAAVDDAGALSFLFQVADDAAAPFCFAFFFSCPCGAFSFPLRRSSFIWSFHRHS